LPLPTPGGNASGAERQQPGGIDSTERPDGKPQSQPTTQPGFGIETQNQQECDLVADMRAQGKGSEEIQNALAALRAGKTSVLPPTSPDPLDPERISKTPIACLP